jgi:hypothetical protein
VSCRLADAIDHGNLPHLKHRLCAGQRMHPVSTTLTEAPPSNSDDSRPVPLLPALSPRNHALPDAIITENHGLQPDASSPLRKDTNSSVSTAATVTSSLTLATDETPGTPYSNGSVASSPTFAAHGIFSARDGSNVGPQRRASRRRTGPLTAIQRDRAHLIRKMGACPDCRRRRVAVSFHSPVSSSRLCRLTALVPP